jgi:hypothetical protein
MRDLVGAEGCLLSGVHDTEAGFVTNVMGER